MKKVILISGGSRGIGRASVIKLLSAGHRVATFSRNAEKNVVLEKDLQNFPKEQYLILQGDMTEEKSLKEVVEQSLLKFGTIDVVINNAGYGLFADADMFEMDQFRHMMETNVIGVAALTKLVLPTMKEKKSGMFINLASVAGKSPSVNGEFYNATKFGLHGYSRGLRLELKPFRIKVCIINPGMVKTDFFDDEKLRKRCEKLNIPFPPPMMDADDIANAIAYVIDQPEHVEIQDLDIMPF